MSLEASWHIFVLGHCFTRPTGCPVKQEGLSVGLGTRKGPLRAVACSGPGGGKAPGGRDQSSSIPTVVPRGSGTTARTRPSSWWAPSWTFADDKDTIERLQVG